MNTSALYLLLTQDLAFGMNALTLAGFVLMGLGINLARYRRIRPPPAFALMGVGTVLVFAGIYMLPRPG